MKSFMKSTFPLSSTNLPFHPKLLYSVRSIKVSINPPPSDFDYRAEIASESRSVVAGTFPELLDLADDGTLMVVQKRRFGPVPAWRSEFIEPDEIWLVGTTHISPESASDVDRVVRTLRPDNVVVELCRSRAGIMYTSSDGELDNQKLRSGMFSLTGTGFFGAVGRSLNLGGQTALALRLLLALFSSKLSANVNQQFGDEFRAARKASEEIGAQLVLGDRPIEITLERAWNSLKLKEKFNLICALSRAITSSNIFSENDFEVQKAQDNSSFQLYERLSFSYPSLLQPLIHERDTYLAWSLKRSKAVSRSKKVVGVIGKGHMNGVIYALVSDQGNLRFRDLAGKKQSEDGSDSWVLKLGKSLARDTILGILLWELYEQIKDWFRL